MNEPAPAQAGIDIERIRAQFPSLAETDEGRPRIYLDNPAGTQVPHVVAERMADCLLYRSANIGGYFRTSELAGEVADEARRAGQKVDTSRLGRLLGVPVVETAAHTREGLDSLKAAILAASLLGIVVAGAAILLAVPLAFA